jgi:hypothetical protein
MRTFTFNLFNSTARSINAPKSRTAFSLQAFNAVACQRGAGKLPGQMGVIAWSGFGSN